MPRADEAAGPACLGTSCGASGLEVEVYAPYVQVTSPWRPSIGAGTCVSIDGELLVLTAGHVVDGYDPRTFDSVNDGEGVTHPVGRRPCHVPTLLRDCETRTVEIPAPVVWFSAPEESGGNDLALLKPRDNTSLTPAGVLDKDDLKLGEPTWYIGTTNGIHARLEQSVVSIVHYKSMNKVWTGTNGCVWFGSSGGGLYVQRNGKYLLAGVITRGADNGPKAMGMCKLPTDIVAFLDSYRKHKKGAK